ncbi:MULTISPECIES: hypothetical protein [unclassified Legionella]|uniref:hypothetical protein n=1 Tax=unclassified Legionella TaxID=2622702 RepID=UPI0010567E65|nr:MULTISPECIES: hypothetical protein [unclassified Legionella]MDI9819305.1 hypothetical protein [Legionella sp. PL877]
MRKVIDRFLPGIVLLLLISSVYAFSSEDARLLKKEYQQYQAWSLARNYFFGTTVKKDQPRALAWQLVYVNQLPSSYPQKEKLLAPFKLGLTRVEIDSANQLAKNLREQFNFSTPFTEAELSRIYSLHEQHVSWGDVELLSAPQTVRGHFKEWIDWLIEHNDSQTAEKLGQRMLNLYAAKRFPIIYGQIIIKGPESPEMVSSEINILPGGFFIAHPAGKSISFNLPGYRSITVAVEKAAKIQSIAPVVFERAPLSRDTGVIGRVLPWSGIEKGNLLLRFKAPNNIENAPWHYPAIPLTITNDGQFYVTELAPGSYQLFINVAGLETLKEFTIRKDEIRGLSLIDLRKIILRNNR